MSIIALTGFMGCGKTSVGRVLSLQLGWKHVDLDAIIEETYGKKISDIFKERGEEAFRELESCCLRSVLSDTDEDCVLSLGGGTVLSALNRQLLKEKTTCIYLKATEESLTQWLDECPGTRPLLQKDSIKNLLQQREEIYLKAADHIICVDELSYSEAALAITRLIRTVK